MKQSNHTEVPNGFFDQWLPKLKGSEIQVFLVICRQTRGWHKETDRISISQLEEKTGLSNRCLIDASKSLKDKGLIYSEMKNGIKSYEIAYEQSSQADSEPMKIVHRGYEDSSQFAYEDSSHTKETITKETKQNKGARVNGCSIPENLQAEDFKKKYEFYCQYIKENYHRWPTSTTTETDLQKLSKLKEKGNDPIKVIDQTIQGRNKSFFALRSYENKSSNNSILEQSAWRN